MLGARLVVTMTTFLAISAVAAACGGGGESRLRTERWIEEANGICKDEIAALSELEVPALDSFDEDLTAAELDEIAAYLERELMIATETSARFEELGLPPDDAGEIEKVLEQREEGRAAIELAIEFARDGDAEQYVASYREAVTAYDKAARNAREFGLEDCGQ
ncbi:MAG TPA: hypothetical protein VF152_10555 [Acidimicrobiia bacterium]